MFAPDLNLAVAFYESLGLRVRRRGELDGARTVTLGFESGPGLLTLHDDAAAQFTDVELRVASVLEAYRVLSLNPEVRWLRPPFETGEGSVAVLRAPDGNVLRLVSRRDGAVSPGSTDGAVSPGSTDALAPPALREGEAPGRD